jgi:CTP:molybdopterin cytidylyltransferase MocA
MKRIAALIMAAGTSSRFGGCKLLADVAGQPMLQRSIDLARGLFPRHVYVVTGAWHGELMEARDKGILHGASFVYADAWAEGLSASLKAGIEYLDRDYDAVLVLLADQIALTRSNLQQLLAAFDGHNIACGCYDGSRGVPAIFSRGSFDRLKQLSGDRGAKPVLYDSVVPVCACPMPAASLDIDRREQLFS